MRKLFFLTLILSVLVCIFIQQSPFITSSAEALTESQSAREQLSRLDEPRSLGSGLSKIQLWNNGIAPSGSQSVERSHTHTEEDERFLEDLSRRCFLYFWESADPKTGLIPDYAQADGSEAGRIGSIAAVGFGLTSYCIADQRDWITREQAYERTLLTLRFLRYEMEHEKGFFYHFFEMDTGKRVWHCELSSIDTALLIAGVITAREHFAGTEVAHLADEIYRRVDWAWMLDGQETLSMGWKPESGFLEARWHQYNELMMLYLLGMGSPTHPLPASSWHAWGRDNVMTFGGRTFIACPPLFTHQYSHAWFQFQGKRDDYADYWQNSVLATLAQQQACVEMADRFPKYSETMWGLTAAVGPNGYSIWGAPLETMSPDYDGTVVPCAPGGSVPFAPEACIATLRNMYDQHKDQSWSHYGFVDAFNPHTGWAAADVLGIDVGITLLMIENYRSGFVWETFHRATEVERAMQLAGFRPLTEQEHAGDRNSSIFFEKPSPSEAEELAKAQD